MEGITIQHITTTLAGTIIAPTTIAPTIITFIILGIIGGTIGGVAPTESGQNLATRENLISIVDGSDSLIRPKRGYH